MCLASPLCKYDLREGDLIVLKLGNFFLMLKYVVCLCRGCDGCCAFCLYCKVWNCRCSCMGSVSASSCRCCMFVSCMHSVEVLNAAFCMTCSLLMLVEDARVDSCCNECFYDL